MKIFLDIMEFHRKVGLLRDIKYSHGIDLEPCWGLVGLFDPHRLNELKEYIEKHPEYHIISAASEWVYFNKILENCFGYYLGDGDKNPEYIGAITSDPVRNFDIEPELENLFKSRKKDIADF